MVISVQYSVCFWNPMIAMVSMWFQLKLFKFVLRKYTNLLSFNYFKFPSCSGNTLHRNLRLFLLSEISETFDIDELIISMFASVQRTRQKENLKRYEKLNERLCARLHPVTCPWHRPFHLCNQHVLVSICTQSAKIIFIHDMKDQIHWLQIHGHRIKCKSLNSNVPVGGNTLTSHPFHKFTLNTTSNCASLKEFTPEYTNHLITSFNCIIKDIETNIR